MNIDQMNLGAQQPPKINADMIRQSKVLECSCGGKIFTEKIILRRISSLITGTGKEEMFPMNLLVCDSCGLVPRELDPDNMIPEEFKTDPVGSK